MTVSVNVKLVSNRAVIGTCELDHSQASPWWVALTKPDGNRHESQAADLPTALDDLRKNLQAEGLDLLCNGCRLGIKASPMSVESGGGRMAYVLRLGVPARKQDIVNIFDEIDISLIASLADKEQFYTQWLESIKATAGEREEAKQHPGGWVYRIDRHFDPNGEVPPSAIIGAWQVGPTGEITGAFQANDNYTPDAFT